MAVVQNYNNNNTDNQNQTYQNQPLNISGSSGGSASSGGAGRSSTAAPTIQSNTPSSSGRFTNIRNYIDANQNYKKDQGGLAGQIYNNLDNKTDKVQQNLNQQQQQFQTNANANRVQYDPNLVNQATTDSANFVQNQSNVDAFGKLRDASYAGPQDLSNSGQLQQQAGNVQSLANLTNNEAGRYTLLNKLYNTPNYNSGQQTLDNLLLQGNQQQLQKLGQTQNLAAGLNTNVNNALTQAKTIGQQYADEAAATKAQTNTALQGAYSGAQGQVDNEYNTALQNQTNTQNQYQSILANLANNQDALTPEQQQLMGVTAGQRIYNVDPSKFLSYTGAQNLTKDAVANSDDYARVAALSKLSGNTLENFLSDPTQAGTYQAAQTSFNNPDFMNAVNEANSAYETGKVNPFSVSGGDGFNFLTKSFNDQNIQQAQQKLAQQQALPDSMQKEANIKSILNSINAYNASTGRNNYL